MKLHYDKDYTDTFHSPGIEPWILGFLKSRSSLGRVLDVGCGLGFAGLLLKLYLGSAEYLVGIDVSVDKISKVRRLGLYDELHVADIRNFKPPRKFNTLIALEVLHGLPADVLMSIENLVDENGLIVISLPFLPEGVRVRDLIAQGYDVYRYLLRGLILIDLKQYRIYLASASAPLKMIKLILILLKPLLKITRALEKGYLLVFKQMSQ